MLCLIIYNSLFLITRIFRFLWFSHYNNSRYKYLMDCANTSEDELTVPLTTPDTLADVNPEHIPKNILSWNVRGLSIYLNADKQVNIMSVISGFTADVVCLQECFDDDLREYLCNNLLQTYPFYVSGDLSKRFIIGEDSGLMIFSKYPITNYKFHKYSESCGADYLSNKGVIYATIGGVNIATTHIQSEYCACYCSSYDKQVILSQIQELIQQNPFQSKMIVCGDLNKKNANILLNSESNNTIPTHETIIHPIDYIVSLNNSYKIMAAPINLKNNPSDHMPMYGIIREIDKYN